MFCSPAITGEPRGGDGAAAAFVSPYGDAERASIPDVESPGH